MSILGIFLLIIGMINLVLGLIVLTSNYKSIRNLLFLVFSSSIAVWVVGVGLFIDSNSIPNNVIYAKVYYSAPVLIGFSFFFLSKTFTGGNNRKFITKRNMHFAVILSLFTFFVISYKKLFINEAAIDDLLGNYVKFNKYIYLYYSVLILSLFVLGLKTLFLIYHKEKGKVSRQAFIFFVGFLITSSFSAYFNLLLPWFGDYSRISLGPIFTSVMSLCIAYSIVRHRLFDIKLIAFRLMGYIIVLSILVVIFALITSFFVQNLVKNGDNNLSVIVNAVFLVVAVLSYGPLKRYFDRVTNRFFFQDAYDPQEFLDQLNKVIVGDIEIGILHRHVARVIEDNIKCSHVHIVVPADEDTPQRVTGTEGINFSQHDLNYMRGRLLGLGKKIITSEDLEQKDDELQKIFDKYGIASLVHMSAESYGQLQTVAFMIYGNKRSGNIYTSADYKIIEIIADELVIATQNALRFEEIQEFNVTLQGKVNAATSKLKKTNEKLKAMDATKDEFISMASHQLRTPLTSVKGYMSMVLDGDAGPVNDTQRKLLEQSFVSSQRMVYLISDLLNVSRLKSGKFVIENKKCNLANVVEGEIAQLAEQASLKDIKINYDKPKDFTELMLDENKIRQVIMNFTDNALYYTPRGGKVDVELSEDKSSVYFMVKDNGIGVPEDEKKHMFTKFYRAKNAREARPDGTGLGLFMAKKVIEAQSGNILFDSKEGKGSTFGFSFHKKSHSVE